MIQFSDISNEKLVIDLSWCYVCELISMLCSTNY
uniref:Uncharacterized protein n=1 Tax=Rhizophora mucronata TaxID=61149 RepID=A0A2P2QUZ7_RHIMU